jgi:pyridoxal phosphate enzyme (YggS family)
MIQANLGLVKQNIERACEKVGKDPRSVRILAVSKNFSKEVIEEARSCGISYFAENRVQEARVKSQANVFEGARLALIGHLQTNKASLAARIFDEIHSVDSERIAQALSKFARQYRDDLLPVYLQVNAGLDPKKHGCMPEQAGSLARAILALDGLRLVGLMTVAPIAGEVETPSKVFRDLRMLRDKLVSDGIPADNLGELSMGMSSDYMMAVEEGATVIRLGTALFGPRIYK